jgi:Flp pilus assembly protein protease CpaA
MLSDYNLEIVFIISDFSLISFSVGVSKFFSVSYSISHSNIQCYGFFLFCLFFIGKFTVQLFFLNQRFEIAIQQRLSR